VLVHVGARHDGAVGREDGVGLVDEYHVRVDHEEELRAFLFEPTADLHVPREVDAWREAEISHGGAEVGQSPFAIFPFSHAA